MDLTRDIMEQRGAAHRCAGLPCTPHHCQDIDRELFTATRTQERPARWYAEMRGAFNRGWEREHARLVSEG